MTVRVHVRTRVCSRTRVGRMARTSIRILLIRSCTTVRSRNRTNTSTLVLFVLYSYPYWHTQCYYG